MGDAREDDEALRGEVPPGGGGADSGSAEVVSIEEGATGAIPDVGSQNEAPGVGARGAGHHEHHRHRRHHPIPPQVEPAMAQHRTSAEEKLRGIVVQTRADLPKAGTARIRAVVRQRAEQAGVEVTDAGLDAVLPPPTDPAG